MAFLKFDDWFQVNPFPDPPEERLEELPATSIDHDVLVYLRLLVRILFAYDSPLTSDVETFCRHEFNHCIATGKMRVNNSPTRGPRLVFESLAPEKEAQERLKDLKAQGATPWRGNDDPTEPTKPLPPPPPEPAPSPFAQVTQKPCYSCARVMGEAPFGQVFTCPNCKGVIQS